MRLHHTSLFRVVGVFVAAIATVGVSIWHDRSNAIQEGVRNAANVGTVLAGQINHAIRSIDIVLREMQMRVEGVNLSEPVDREKLLELRDRMVRQLNHLPQAYQIVVVNPSGQLVASTAAWPTPRINVADRDYFQDLAAHDDDRLSISVPFANRVNQAPTIVMARRLGRADGSFNGTVFISVNTRHFEGVYGAVTALPDQIFTLFRRDGTVLVRFPADQSAVGKKIPPEWPFHRVVRDGGGSYRSPGAFDSTTRWIAVSPIQDYALVVTVAVPEEILLHGWWSRSASTTAATSILLACAVALLWLLFRRENRLVQQNELFDTALNNMSHSLVMFDAGARMVVCNKGYLDMFGLTADDVRPGCTLHEVMCARARATGYPTDVDAHVKYLLESVARREIVVREIPSDDGRVFEVRRRPMADGGWVATHEDITARRASEAKIRLLAHSDLVTGLANRSSFMEQIETARDRLHGTGAPFAVLMLDLDRFKHVNDSLGHAAGDVLLKEVARRLTASSRDSDVLARIGGDEFAIVQGPPRDFKEHTDPLAAMRESAAMLAARILGLVGEPVDIAGHSVVVGASIGIAVAPFDGVDPVELMKKADLALYRSKADGGNGCSFFDDGLAVAAGERQQIEDDLRIALARDEFELLYQPQIAVATGRTCAMEALLRWHHPVRGLMTPDHFISIAEDSGLIVEIGDWVLQKACAQAAGWPETIRLAVNISPVQFLNERLFDVILCALMESGLPPERLEIEITERVLLQNNSACLSMLRRLRSIGVSVALDDFGTGYASLGYLRMFPFSAIKIDRLFARDVATRRDCAAIVAAIINMARSLDMITTAEGIETPDQFDALRIAGVTRVQGFLFGRPKPLAEIDFGGTAADGRAAATA
jgi:diguanylate cyclase (GGDEF)-like protein